MTRLKLTIEYNGLPYAGWQRQKEAVSVQQTIEDALAKFIKEKPVLTVAGRTDAGVHAMGQVAHFDLTETATIDPAVIQSATNHYLRGKKISILSVEEVAADFNARFTATMRRYLYRVTNRRAPLTFEEHLSWHVSKKLESEKIKQAINYLVGYHDFSSFRDSKCQAKNPIRTLKSAEFFQQDSDLSFHFSAQSFLHHQVRIMVGTLIDVGLGKTVPQDIQTILLKADRRCAGPTAPPFGLYLRDVVY